MAQGNLAMTAGISAKFFTLPRKVYAPSIFFWAFIFAYALLFLINPQLGPTDDFVFLRTLQSGKPLLYFSQDFPYYDSLELGRLNVLASLEYNLVAIFSNSPFWYFFYHAVQFIVFIVIFLKILDKVSANKLLNYSIIVLLLLIPAFTIAWFRLQLTERNVLFFFAVFLLIYLAYLERQKWRYFWGILLTANIAIYYKEVAFLTIAVFALTHLIFSRRNSAQKIKIADGLLILSSLIYFSLYYFIVLQNSALKYLSRQANPLLAFLKNILNYGFFSDPLLIWLLIPVSGWRLYKIFWKKDAFSIYDSMLAGALVYAAAFFALNIYGPYYLLPAYIFAIPALIRLLQQEKEIRPALLIASALTGVILIVNSLPAGIHYLTYNKYLPVNFNQTLDFLVKDINSRYAKNPKGKPGIYLYGADRGTGLGTYFVLAEFLEFRGLNSEKFDMQSEIEGKESFSSVTKIQPPFTVFRAGPGIPISTGDYLIVSPQSVKNTDTKYLQSLQKDYRLVFETKSPFALPSIDLKTSIKYYLSEIAVHKPGEEIISNENLTNWPDYYVFIKK